MAIRGNNNLDKTSAAPVLAGFRYQLLQTLVALMSLRFDETLVLEVSEDFSVLSAEASTDFQVKHSQAASGPTPHSLQSSDVIKLLTRFWTSAQSPEGAQRRLVFLARGGAALEREFKFPDKISGLKYWAAAATDADPAPIRAALAETHKDTLLGEWLRTNPSDEEFRARLLTRVSWQLDLKPAESLVAQLQQQASSFYFDRKLPVSAAKQAIDSLLALAIEVASRPDIDGRKLSVIDLHTTLETAAGTNLVAQQMHGVPALTPVTSSHDIFIAEADVASIASHRAATVTDCLTKVAGLPLAWVHGAHGVGKSILARLMAHRTGGRWIALDLWPVRNDPTGALGAWRETLRAFDQGIRPKGIIIDDFGADSATALKPLLTALTQTMQAWGGRVIVTSHHAPSPAHMLEFSSSASGIIQAPYFSENDIADLVRVAPAPDETMVKSWIAMISLTTGGGQPLLVAAKVASLRARDWPAEALLEDFGTPSEAIRLTKEEQRRKLVTELNQLDQARSLEAGQLLRRIACIFDRVDEKLAMGLVKAAPALPNGGDALAVLRGSWLESLPKGDFRVSPLIADITTDVPAEQAKEWRRFAAEYWLGQMTLDQRTLPLCFWNAFTGEHDWVLLKICEIILSMEREKRRGVAPILSPLTAFSTDKRLYAPHELIGVHLRLLQFDIADALGEKETAGKAAARLFIELDQLENDDARVLLTMLAVPKVLMAPDASISPHLRLECALRARSNLARARVLFEGQVPAADALLPPWFKPEWDFADFLFSMILPHLQDSQAELEAFEALSILEEGVRNRFIDSMSSTYGMSVFANAGWANEQVSNQASIETLSRYVKISEIVSSWNRPDIEIELVCARAVVLDEILSDAEAAIALLDASVDKYGAVVPLIRQQAKTVFRVGRPAEAAELMVRIEDTVGADSPLDRTLIA
jgi:hypothetical protein